jgi:uracil-DNA glycosylase
MKETRRTKPIKTKEELRRLRPKKHVVTIGQENVAVVLPLGQESVAELRIDPPHADDKSRKQT